MASTMLHRVFPGLFTRRCGHAGFSMPEIMVTVAVAGVLTGVAVPSLSAMLQAQRASSLASNFVASLHLARGEAIKRNGRAVVCKSATGDACTGSGGWEQGWIVFHDVNNNAALDVGERVVLAHGGVAAGPRLTGNTPVANYVSYGASGSSKLISGAFQAGTFTLCPAPGSNASGLLRQIILSPTGRPRIFEGASAACR